MHPSCPAVFSLAALLSLSLTLPACKPQEPAAKPTNVASAVVPVTLTAAKKTSVPRIVEALGNVQASAVVDIKPRITGQLQSIHFQEGQPVKQGDLLFTIDPQPFEIALEQTRATLARDTVSHHDANREANRLVDLLAQNASTQREVDRQRTIADALAQTLRINQQMVRQAELNLSYCQIFSPLDGIAGSLELHPGELTKANDNPILLQISAIQPVHIAFSVPEQYLSDIRRKQAAAPLKVDIRLPDQLESAPALAASVVMVSAQVDVATGMIQLKAASPNADHALWPGQFVRVLLRLEDRPDQIVVPPQAVQRGQNQSLVYVVKPDQTVEARPVEAESVSAQTAIIHQGLAEGETIVLDGHLRLAPGVKILDKNKGPG